MREGVWGLQRVWMGDAAIVCGGRLLWGTDCGVEGFQGMLAERPYMLRVRQTGAHRMRLEPRRPSCIDPKPPGVSPGHAAWI